MPISTEMMVRVAHADIAMRMAFPRSVGHWHHEDGTERPWKARRGGCGALLIGRDDAVVVDGNCSNGISAPDGGAIHIYGNLTSTIDAAGHHEIIITGDVTHGATIDAAGFCHLFVGGAFAGELRSTSSSKLWIGCDFDGLVKTGDPSTEIHIGGNFSGDISPNENASLLWLTIAGFAPQASLLKIVDCGYTLFNACVPRSDVAPGIYPSNGHRKSDGRRSLNRWCVETENARL